MMLVTIDELRECIYKLPPVHTVSGPYFRVLVHRTSNIKASPAKYPMFDHEKVLTFFKKDMPNEQGSGLHIEWALELKDK